MKALQCPSPRKQDTPSLASHRSFPGSSCREFAAVPQRPGSGPPGAALPAPRDREPPRAGPSLQTRQGSELLSGQEGASASRGTGGTPYLFAPAWQRRQVLHPPAVHRHSRLLTGGTGGAGAEANEVGVMVLLNEPPESHASGRVLRAALLNAAAWLRKQTPSPLRNQKVRGRKGSHVTCGLGAHYINPFQQITRALGMCCVRRRVKN